MNVSPRHLDEAGKSEICARLTEALGGYLRNVVRESGLTCAVCTGPVAEGYATCYRCHHDQNRHGDRLAAHGRHVLVVDDTWATGSRAQSAALALKSAGAEAVTVLVLARWLNPQDGTPTARFLRRAWPESYDPRLCPVSAACS